MCKVCSQDVLVSIIVPVYNCKNFIKECLCSALEQSYSNIELIVIDDGSTDGSDKIIKEVTEGKENVVSIRQINAGVSAARNAGIQNATGKYLLFLDGDDYIGTDYVYHLVEAAEQYDSDLVIGGYIKVDTEKNMLDRVVPGIYIPFEHEEWACRITAVCSRIYKKEVWDKYEMRFEEGVRGEDVPISLFFNAMCKNIKTIQVAEYYYVQHSGSTTHNFRGLQKFKLPYKTIENVLKKVNDIGEVNSREFFELGFMRFFTQCIFDLGKGAQREQILELCGFVKRIMIIYLPDYWENSKSSIWSDLDIPLVNKIEVKIFMLLLKFDLLYVAAKIYNKL